MKRFVVCILALMFILCSAFAEETSDAIKPIEVIVTPEPTATPEPTPTPLPPREVKIYCSHHGAVMEGERVTFTAELINFFDIDQCHYVWQYSVDGNSWNDISNSDSNNYTVTVTQENYLYYWRVKVIH